MELKPDVQDCKCTVRWTLDKLADKMIQTTYKAYLILFMCILCVKIQYETLH